MKMRNIILLSGLAVLSLASCKKDYRCECTLDDAYFIHYDYTNMTEEGAAAACLADQTLTQQDYSNDNIHCAIK
jgi:hypothetical protein